MKKYLILSGLLYFLSLAAVAQTTTLKETEHDLSETYSKIFPFYYSNADSLNFYSDQFNNKFTACITRYPSTLVYPFKTLIDSNNIFIISSKDSLFRIYSWDTWLGGTMHDFKNIYQYQSDGKVYSKTDSVTEGSPTVFYSDIFILKANDRTYYLAINNGMYSTQDVSESIQIFSIDGDKLNDTVKLIKTDTHFTNEIDVPYNFFKLHDSGERPLRIIKYNASKKIIYIPVVLESGQVTNRFIVYKFNGQYFEKQK